MQRILLFISGVCLPWSLNPNDFIDSCILKELEDSGFVRRLYSN
jgi:hypothetical protein